ncbi:phage major capsid protein [Lancefieldella parvula]|jgi:HK97 family phage major capsid protein|uniref:phage major capsid protein n=1 Tax=Lancefieldella parvula TaxID=1382 RepID=UPI0028D91176|nr:phage major capsid protein [Lancefieldella parvula]
MPATNTTNIKLPVEIAKDLVSKVADTSVIQTLSASSPAIFANRASILFTQDPEAEIVGESAQHSSQTVGLKPVDHTIKKLSVTVRFSNEVQWADEDSQLQIVDAIVDKSAAALGRGLDYLVFHALNPATGMPATGLTALTAGATAVTATTDPAADLDALADAVDPGYSISGIGLSKAYASSLRKVRVKNTGLRMFPEIPINLNTGVVDGLAAATSNTVSGALAKTATKVLAVMGDFNLIKWGIVRDINIETIETGDPDGLGDLKRLGQVAYRAEVVYSYAVIDPKGFAVLKSA